MKDEKLREILRQYQVKGPSEEAEGKAWEYSRLAFENQPSVDETQIEELKHHFSWSSRKWMALAALSVVISIVTPLYWKLAEENTAPVESPLISQRDEQLLREMKQMFPERLRGMVMANGDMRLVVADSNVESSQTVLLEISDGKTKSRIINYVGESIDFEFAGKKGTLETLVTTDEKVIVIFNDKDGNSFVWKSDNPKMNNGLKIRAKILTLL